MKEADLHIMCNGGSVDCSSFVYSCRDGFKAMQIRMSAGKAYGIKGGIGSGNWAMCKAIADPILHCDLIEKIMFGKTHMLNAEFKNIVCDVEAIKGSDHSMTVREVIEKSLINSEVPLSEQEIKCIFHLSNERFERTLDQIGLEIYRVAIAKGMLEGKKLFVFPFIGQSNIVILNSIEPCLRYMLTNGVIILLPYDTSINIDYLFDFIITMKYAKVVAVEKNLKHIKYVQHILFEFLKRKYYSGVQWISKFKTK